MLLFPPYSQLITLAATAPHCAFAVCHQTKNCGGYAAIVRDETHESDKDAPSSSLERSSAATHSPHPLLLLLARPAALLAACVPHLNIVSNTCTSKCLIARHNYPTAMSALLRNNQATLPLPLWGCRWWIASWRAAVPLPLCVCHWGITRQQCPHLTPLIITHSDSESNNDRGIARPIVSRCWLAGWPCFLWYYANLLASRLLLGLKWPAT